jgi:hypothetical protein
VIAIHQPALHHRLALFEQPLFAPGKSGVRLAPHHHQRRPGRLGQANVQAKRIPHRGGLTHRAEPPRRVAPG